MAERRKSAMLHEGNRRTRSMTCLLIAGCLATSFACAQEHEYQHSVSAIQQQIESGNLDGARAAILDAEKRYPANGGLENLLGVVEIQLGHASAARQAFSAAIQDDPRLVGAYLNMSRMDMPTAARDVDARAEALQLSEKVLQLDPTNDVARYQVATILAWEKNYARSLAELEQLSEQAKKEIGAQALACEDHAALGNHEAEDKAVQALTANAEMSEQDADACVPMLRVAHRADLIVNLLSAAAERHPLSPAGLQLLGLAQEADGKLVQARATLEKAFAADSTSAATLIDLTRIAKNTGDNQGALGYLAHARDLRPKDSSLAYEFGVICLRMGLYKEASQAIGDALKLAPDNPAYNLSMGLITSFDEYPSEALPYLQKYHQLRPQDPNGMLALGNAFFHTKDYDTARVWLKQAVTHPETAAEAHYYLGCIARQEGHLNEAMAELKESLQLLPGQISTLVELGQTALEAGNDVQASEYLERALALDPNNYFGNFALLKLYARTHDPRLKQQTKRFEQAKNQHDTHEMEMMRSIVINRNEELKKPGETPE